MNILLPGFGIFALLVSINLFYQGFVAEHPSSQEHYLLFSPEYVGHGLAEDSGIACSLHFLPQAAQIKRTHLLGWKYPLISSPESSLLNKRDEIGAVKMQSFFGRLLHHKDRLALHHQLRI